MTSYKNNRADYEDVYVIAENEKGTVKLVCHKDTSEKLVVKEANGEAPSIYERLLTVNHPNMPKIYEVWSESGKYFVVQEHIKGITLFENLTENGKLTAKEVKDYALQLCDVLKLLHSQNPPIIHRDIKPSNVMLTNGGTVKLIDFDSSRVTNTSSETDTRHVVTKGYAPPEQYGFSQTDGRADIYSMGKLMYTLLTGNSDNNTKSYKGKFKRVIRKCTKLDPKQRYSKITHLENDLKKIASLKYSAIKAIKISATILILCCGIAFVVGENIPQRAITQIKQIGKVYNLPHKPQTYIDVVKSLAYERDITQYYRYCLGRAFKPETVKWSYWVTDDDKRHVILDGTMVLQEKEMETKIVFEIDDKLASTDIVEVSSDILGKLTALEDIEYFIYVVSFEYWDLAYMYADWYIEQYLSDMVYPNAELVIYNKYKFSENSSQNPVGYDVYDKTDTGEIFLGTFLVDRYTKEIFKLNQETKESELFYNPFE